MSEIEIKWLHSHGWDNKDPNYDLGGDPSKFEIAELPANNLFDDVLPGDSSTDWRCFYIANKYQDTNYHIELTLIPPTFVTIAFGSVVRNEQQKVTFQGPSPTEDGFFIIQMNWGPALTVFWNNSYAAMAADMEAQIQTVKYHEDVTVTVSSIFPNDAGATFTVEFLGELKSRRMGLIKIIQNNLYNSGHQEYRVDNTGSAPGTWNWEGSNTVRVHDTIDLAPTEGMIHIPYPYNDLDNPQTWQYMHLSYSSWGGFFFNLAGAIPTIPVPAISVISGIPPPQPQLGENDEVWVDLPQPPNVNVVNVTKLQEGSPINQLAAVVNPDESPIDWSDQGSTWDVGLLRPLESFYVWVRRDVVPESGIKDEFGIELVGTSV